MKTLTYRPTQRHTIVNCSNSKAMKSPSCSKKKMTDSRQGKMETLTSHQNRGW